MAAIRNVELKNLGDGCSGAAALVDYPGAHKQALQLTELVRDFVITPGRQAKWSHIAKALKQSPMYVEAEVDLPNGMPKMVLRIMDEGVVELRQEMDAQGFKSYSKTDTTFTLGGKLPAKSRDLIEENSAMTAISLNTFYHIAGVPIGDSDRSDAQHYACFSPPFSPEDGVNKGSKVENFCLECPVDETATETNFDIEELYKFASGSDQVEEFRLELEDDGSTTPLFFEIEDQYTFDNVDLQSHGSSFRSSTAMLGRMAAWVCFAL